MDLVRFFLRQHAATHAGDGSGRPGRFDVDMRTREVVGALAPGAWDETRGLADTTRAHAAGAFGPNDDWVDGVGHRPWQGLARGDQLGSTALRHNAGHIGEAVTIRGLVRARPPA